MASSSRPLIVAAIDFGTTYSGWAFSFRHEFDKDPLKVSAKNWSGGQLVSLKGPTCVLLQKKGDEVTLKAFGYEAESRYAELAGEGEHKGYYFFRRFKMMLFGKVGMQGDIMLEDVSGEKLPALTVFTLAIKELKKDLLEMSQSRIAGGGLGNDDVHWVLTVPAIWNDVAKQFMRKAAVAATIPEDRLTIALEPEAASLYCRYIPMEKTGVKSKTALATLRTGTKYMVLDAGGGTVDITVHEVMDSGQLKELHKASGGAWGGTKVDEAYRQFLIKLMGHKGDEVMTAFQRDCMEDYIDMFRDFEVKKRTIDPDKTGKVTIRLPIAFSEIFDDIVKTKLNAAIPKSPYANKVSLSGDKLRMDADLAKTFFTATGENIVNHVKELFKDPAVKGCASILMVGGFSESKMIEDAVRRAFPDITIIVPPEAGLAVLKGAVIFGHSPDAVAERRAKFTYGIATRLLFQEGVHPESKKIFVDDEVRVKDVFDVHVKAGQVVKLGEAQTEQGYTPATASQTSVGFTLYATEDPDPKFVTDPGCQKIGHFSVPVPDTTGGKKRSVKVRMIFGGTEVQVEGVEEATGKKTLTSVDFLG